MDTGKDYIKMCEKAQEIQESKSLLEDGDYYVIKNRRIVRNFNNELWQLGYPKDVFEGEKPIFLPKQDQLQDMIDSNKYSFNRWIEEFYKFAEATFITKTSEWKSNGDCFPTFEQLWLAFVMKEKHNKTWNTETKEWKVV